MICMSQVLPRATVFSWKQRQVSSLPSPTAWAMSTLCSSESKPTVSSSKTSSRAMQATITSTAVRNSSSVSSALRHSSVAGP